LLFFQLKQRQLQENRVLAAANKMQIQLVSVSCAEIQVSPGDSPEYACHAINLNYFLAIAYLNFLFAYDGLTCCFALLVTIDVFLVQWNPYSMVGLMDIASVLGLVSCGRHPLIDPWLVVFHCFSLAKTQGWSI
jgi:hypothetical protein